MQAKPAILITGASGFIGKHLAELAIKKGYAVHALVRKTSKTEELKRLGANILYGDLAHTKSILNVFGELYDTGLKIDYIIHAAALTKAKTEKDFLNSNVKTTQHLLAAVEQFGLRLKKFIFISSLAASGPQHLGAVIEKDQNSPITRYGKSKLQAERIVRSFQTIPHIILRPTAVYGPGEKDLLSVFKIVSKGINPSIGFSRQELTFIYVKDLVELILSALITEEKNKTYFITDSAVYKKTDFADTISGSTGKRTIKITLPLFLIRSISLITEYGARMFGKQSALTLEKYKELTAKSWNCNVEDTFKELNYFPAYTLKTGIEETTNWYKRNNWI